MTPTEQPGLSFDQQAYMDLFHAGDWDQLATEMLDDLKHFEETVFFNLSDNDQFVIDSWMRAFLFLFTQPDFLVPDKHWASFIRHNATIANLAALSCFGSTDAHLALVLRQENNLGKMLTLYSARNKTAIRPKAFFDSSVDAASLWYTCYAQSYRGGLANPDVMRRTAEHLSNPDPRLAPGSLSECYFGSTYVDGVCDRPIKQALNRSLRSQQALRNAPIRNTPNPNKVAVITGRWWTGHSVWRTLRAYVESLRDCGFHITGIPTTETPDQQIETSLFDEVRPLPDQQGAIDLTPIVRNDFAAVYYPDIGMTPRSILLSNLRLAPVQMVGTGHPVSTWGSEIDYFMSGDEVEGPGAERNYSERLVLLPGLGAIYDEPAYVPTGRVNTTGRVLVNCSWYGQKVNARFVAALSEIVRRSTRPLHFRIFSGQVLYRANDYLVFVRELQKALAPAVVDVAPNLAYETHTQYALNCMEGREVPGYMSYQEEGDLALDCFHFGGSNTVSDNLHLRKPIVTWDASHWYGRIGSALVRRAGLPELAARSEREYIETALRLIHDDEWRAEMAYRLETADLATTVYDRTQARYFGETVRYLIENQQALADSYDRAPLRMRELLDEQAQSRAPGGTQDRQGADAGGQEQHRVPAGAGSCGR